MKTYTLALALSGVVVSTCSALTTISFDGLQAGEDVLNYYNGGLGSMGSGPGPVNGVAFSAGWIAGPPDAYGAVGGKSASIAASTTVDIAGGWSGLVSFYYLGGPLVVNFYSQVDAGGSLVGTLTVPTGASSFAPVGLDAPFFKSAVFLAPNGDRIDALTNGGLVVPEPAAAGLLLLALGTWAFRSCAAGRPASAMRSTATSVKP